MNAYADQEKARAFDRIRGVCALLPDYCGTYINAVATKKDTSFRTGMQYAYDIQTFMEYLAEKNGLEPKDVPASLLGSLLPMDIEEYISHLSSYETPEDRAYNERLRYDKEEARRSGNSFQRSILSKPERRHQKSAAARARSLAAVRGLYRHLLKNGLVSANPAESAQTPIQQTKPVVAMDGQEVAELLRRVDETDVPSSRKKYAERTHFRDTAIITLLLYTGIRVSECAGIDLQDIDYMRNAVRILRKGGDVQYVYFNDEVRNALKDYIEIERRAPEYDKNALFIGRFGERLSTKSIGKVVEKYTGGISAKKYTAHKLRASYATQLYKNTSDAMLVKDALGHKTLGVVQKYIAAADENRQDAAKKIKY